MHSGLSVCSHTMLRKAVVCSMHSDVIGLLVLILSSQSIVCVNRDLLKSLRGHEIVTKPLPLLAFS